MAEGGLKGSRSAEGLHEKDKPGKLSSDLLNKFKSDPALTCLQPLPVGHGLLSAQSFTSSSEEMSTSQGNIKLAQTSAVIKVPDNSRDPLSPSSGDEDILSDDETGTTKDKKKRKSRWKWSPLKRMKKIFRRKKSPTRVKSCEEIPAEHYKPTFGVSSLEDDASLRNRTKSEPSLAEAKTKSPQAVVELHERRNTFDNPVQTEQSKPMNRPSGELIKTLETEGKSQESISKVPFMSSDKIASQVDSTGLGWKIISSDSGTEAAVSFEKLPSASSLEGLQVARDRIKVAPKHRRPPSRALSNKSSKNMKGNPLKPHRQSKTDPQEFSSKSSTVTESIEGKGNSENSDVINVTISEDTEIKNEPGRDEIVAELKANGTEILNKALRSSTVLEKKEENNLISPGDVSKAEDIIETKGIQEQETTVGSIEASIRIGEDNEDKSFNRNEKDTTIQSKESVKTQKKVSEPREEVPQKYFTSKETSRPFLDLNKGSKSLYNFEKDSAIQSKENQKTQKKESDLREEVPQKNFAGKEISRPFLDLNMRSKSLKNFKKTEQTEESPVKSPLQRGFSLNSIKQNGEKSDLKLEKLEKNRKQGKNVIEQSKSLVVKNLSQISQACKVQSLAFVPASPSKAFDADKVPQEKEKASNQPAWIALANRRSKRLSQLLNDTRDNQVSLEMKKESASAVILQPNNQGDTSDPSDKKKPKLPTKPERLTKKTASNDVTNETEKRKALNQSPSGGRDLPRDKCVVCGRTVFQMEKCNFDSSVLHRQCIKCSVCKRLLTIGNFVIAESKVYCKPHGQVVSVSL
ncbi:LIM domain and actin-binding protein 1 [Pocillopora verrucosa]|uniref:LIM domain and actin-binding protein 1 n=1 Tax=Pocillopora verrucosa TaxID=203993 RepID=UPI0033416AB9